MNKHNSRYLIATAVAIIGSILASPARGQTYDPATQFSSTSNPNGAWSYGFQSGLLGAGFSLYPDQFTYAPGVQAWDIAPGDNPSVTFNPTNSPITITDTTWPAMTIALHPGAAGEFSKIRFTMPISGQVSINSSFFGNSTAPATTDVHVLLNGVSLFDGFVNLNGSGNQTNYSTVIAATQNDVIDFAVGRGNGTILSDTTGLQATLDVVPEPSAAVLVGLAGMMMLGLGRSRARQSPAAAIGFGR